RVVDLTQDTQAALVVTATGRRDRHLARRASKQRNAQLAFERADLAADRGRGDAKLLRRCREAAGLDDANVRRHLFQDIHPRALDSYLERNSLLRSTPLPQPSAPAHIAASRRQQDLGRKRPMAKAFEGKVVLVTGANSGIGEA